VEGLNHFEGRIKDRSYMGGEVSYFIELGARPARESTSSA
jgi:hypothetical protein